MVTAFRFEGFTLTVQDVSISVEYYTQKLGFTCEWNAAPHFAMLRLGSSPALSMGLLSWAEAEKDGCAPMTPEHKRSIHVELSTDNLDQLYIDLQAKGLKIHVPPHDEPWERSMTALDPDGYSVEFAQGKRGKK